MVETEAKADAETKAWFAFRRLMMDLDERVGELSRAVCEMRDALSEAVASLDALTLESERRRYPIAVPCLRVGSPDLPKPRYAKSGDSGMDLRADLTYFNRTPKVHPVVDGMPVLLRGSTWLAQDRIRLDHGARLTVGCGFAFGTPDGLEWQVRPRSGNSVKGVDEVLGTCDGNYRGEITLTICNWSGWPLTIVHGDRLAQVVLADVRVAELVDAEALDETARGDARHGSTGVA